HRLRPGLPRPARVLRPQRARDPRHAGRLHRRHRPRPAPVTDPQQRPGRAARLHPRYRPARRVTTSWSPSADEAPASPLRNPGFRALMAFRICTILSYQIVAVTVGWHVYEITRSPFALGLIGLAVVLPYFCIAPFAGYLVDHLPRRKLGVAACCGLL